MSKDHSWGSSLVRKFWFTRGQVRMPVYGTRPSLIFLKWLSGTWNNSAPTCLMGPGLLTSTNKGKKKIEGSVSQERIKSREWVLTLSLSLLSTLSMFDFLIPRRQSSTSSRRPTTRRRRRSDSDLDIKPSSNKASSLPPRPGLPSHQSYFLDVYISFPSLEDEENNCNNGILS